MVYKTSSKYRRTKKSKKVKKGLSFIGRHLATYKGIGTGVRVKAISAEHARSKISDVFIESMLKRKKGLQRTRRQ